MIIAKHVALLAAEARASAAENEAKLRALQIEKLEYTVAKLRHQQFGQSSERGALLAQLELQLSELQENASEAEAAALLAAEKAKINVQGFERRRPARRPLPEHLPRERIVYPSPSACPCCGGALHKLGEDVTETLELIPRQWKVIQHVREKLSCRSCEAITQPPAPSHPIARGRAGPGLLAHILFAKYGLHLPLNRQSKTYAREGIDLFYTVWYLSSPDPLEMCSVLRTGEFSNYGEWSDPEFDQVVNEAIAIDDPAARSEKTAEAQRIANAQLPWLPLFTGPMPVFVGERITGVAPSIAFLYFPWAATIGAR